MMNYLVKITEYKSCSKKQNITTIAAISIKKRINSHSTSTLKNRQKKSYGKDPITLFGGVKEAKAEK
jgi:hypothetical protein